jgi:hypothetical protein
MGLDDLGEGALDGFGGAQQTDERLLLAGPKDIGRLWNGFHALSVWSATALGKQLKVLAAERLLKAVSLL